MQSNPNEIETLKATIKELREEIEQLKAENSELRRRLGLDSTNSNKPPSSDGYKKKNITPAIPKDKHPKGGQKGHKGKTLERVENPDHIVLHLPQKCQCCGRNFNDNDQHEVVQNRQVFDLPQPKLEITEHRVGEICCCGVAQRGEFPPDVTATVQYGPRVRALATMLSVDHKMPMDQINQLFKNIYGCDLNSSTVIGALNEAFENAAPFEAATKQDILKADVAHFDETGIRVKGKLYWLHTASTKDSTHLFVSEHRGKEALESEASVIKDYTGTAVHDCLPSYFNFEKSRHTLCGAHLLRELNGLKENGSLWATEMHEFLLNLYKMPCSLMAKGAEELRAHYHSVLDKADKEEPPSQRGKRGRPKQSEGRNLMDRLRMHSDGVLAFAFEEVVPFTNNQAERDLRGAKVKQKVSGCFRTVEGANVYARLQAGISTVRKRGGSVFNWLRDLLSPPKVGGGG
jgi:transposase